MRKEKIHTEKRNSNYTDVHTHTQLYRALLFILVYLSACYFCKIIQENKRQKAHDKHCNYIKRGFVIVLIFTCVSESISYVAQVLIQMGTAERPAVLVK